MINKQKITDWLSDKSKTTEESIMFTSPAYLFTNQTKDNKFGNIILFERFGSASTNTYRFTSEITNHYMEDNVSMQDHWAIPPDTYVLSGLIGEVIYTPPKMWQNFVTKEVNDYLTPLNMLMPVFDNYTQSALNVVQYVETSARRYEQIARNLYKDFNNIPITSNQKKVANLLKSLQLNRQLVTIWTPYNSEMGNMAIESVSISQENSKYQSRLEVQLKQWRNISTASREATEEEKRNYLAHVQKMQEQDSGVAATQDRGNPESTLLKMAKAGKNLIDGI